MGLEGTRKKKINSQLFAKIKKLKSRMREVYNSYKNFYSFFTAYKSYLFFFFKFSVGTNCSPSLFSGGFVSSGSS